MPASRIVTRTRFAWVCGAALAVLFLLSSRMEANERVLIFAGQSNMQGKGTANSAPPANLQAVVPNVQGFYCNAYDDTGGVPEPYGMDLYPAGGFRYDWATAKATDGAYYAGGTWQPYAFWKQSWEGTSRAGPYTYTKGTTSLLFWHLGLNPGEPWANAATFHSGEPVQEYGPELMVAQTVHAARPDETFGIVKYAPGGTNLAESWNPTNPVGSYAAMKAWVQCALASRPGATVAGFFWFQGESDANTKYSPHYYANLTNLIAQVRADFGEPNLPIVIAMTHPGDPARNYGAVYSGSTDGIETVRAAQAAVAAADPAHIRTVETADLSLLHQEWNQWKALHGPVVPPHHKDDAVLDDMMNGPYNAPLHIDAAGIQTIGVRMGRAWLALTAAL